MASEGRHFSDYDASLVPVILGEAAYVCRSLGFPGGHLVIVGGLVPSILVPTLEPGITPHVGSRDLDFCLRVALLNGDVGRIA